MSSRRVPTPTGECLAALAALAAKPVPGLDEAI